MESRFTGGLLGLFGIKLLCGFLIIITLSIAVPWVVCIKQNWYAKHTFIDGEQLTFDGTGGQLIGNYIKWFFLCLITLGIYSFWLGIKVKAWTVKHTHKISAVKVIVA